MARSGDRGISPEHKNRNVTVLPKSGRFESLQEAVVAGGAELSDISDARALVWADPALPHELPEVMAQGPRLEWVALPFAGIEPYVPYLNDAVQWTCARGVYARPVAEHAVGLALAGLRGLAHYSRQTEWSGPVGRNLIDGNVTIVGGGGIAEELIQLLSGWNCAITVVRRSEAPMAGAHRTVTTGELADAVGDADVLVLATALTDETRHMIDANVFEAMPRHAWLVNVARGGVVDTDALLAAIRSGQIGGAALDVTDPEPLPEDHPLWAEPRVMITPHIGNTPEMGIPLLARHIQTNVQKFVAGQPLDGLVDVSAGY